MAPLIPMGKMESWSNGFLDMMQAIVDEVEQFATEVSKDVEAMLDGLIEASEEFADQMEQAIAPDLEQRLNEFFDPILEAYLGFQIFVEESAQPMMHTVEPMLNEHPACVGCRNYHGQSYNGVMLVCGMHPSGWEDEKCPDWQSVWEE